LAWVGEVDAPDVVSECCELLPLWAVAPEELVPLLAVPLGCNGAGAVLFAALELPLLLVSALEAPADPVGAAVVCSWAGDELA